MSRTDEKRERTLVSTGLFVEVKIHVSRYSGEQQLTAVVLIQNQMIINSSGYGGSIKERNSNRDYLKKKKSQEAFYIKAKLNSQLGEHLKYLHPRKSQAKVSTSMVEIPTKEDPRRACSSLEMGSGELSVLDGMQPVRASANKQKRNVGHCWSERNMTLLNDVSKMQKYRKFSSNAELGEEQSRPESQRRKLSLVEAPVKKIDKMGLMAWLVLIRKLFVEEFKKRSSRTVRLSVLQSYIQKLDNEGLDEFSLVIEPLEYEVDLTKTQIIAVLESYFSPPIKKGGKPVKADHQFKVSFCEIMTCLLQFQSKNSNQLKQNPKSTSSEEEAVETARFQQGGEELKKRKLSQKKSQLNSLMPKMQTHKYIKENGKENAVISANINAQTLFKSPSACNKSKQSLNPSQSPFTITDSRSIQNSRVLMERDESGPLLFKKSGFENEGSQEELLGMLTIQGKSPRELMVSEIYESILKEGFAHNNNVSFSLEHIDIDTHPPFEHTVHSFEEVLRKIKNIQNSYKERLDQMEDPKLDRNEVNLFLEQLINYRIATSNEPFEEEAYSYLVSFQNLTEFKEHNREIMQAFLQSKCLKQYFNDLEGIKIQNSPPFLKSISHLLHPAIRIMNISFNSLANINFITDQLPPDNALEFLNINHNFFTDVSPILRKCGKLRELHCHSNLIGEIRQCKIGSQQLKIIDLSSNKLEQQKDLQGLVGVSSLIIINILDNPLSQGSWKSEWGGSINLNNIYTMENLYAMSSYGHQKDITFSIDKPALKNRDKTTEFTISENTRTNNEPKTSKQPTKADTLSTGKLSYKPPEPPKQKISKIKAFIDGKII